MKTLIFKTSASYAPLVIRTVLGLIIFAHGIQKLFGWFGGFGFSGTMNFFTDVMHLPWIIGFLVIILESFGAIALIAGAATRIIAASYVILALGIVFTSHIQNGFYMNWIGSQAGEGYEFFLLWIGMAISLFITGAGIHSVDNKIPYDKPE
ncbi:DoxX family protein [Ekhidna sp.]|uniref:DoxX family protein n=1 Tax=Ekhidna sp. TaxID=2608089 RepID=UPI003296BF87